MLDRLIRTAAVSAVVLAVAGCASHPQRRAVEQALARSPKTYWHYRAAVWWGKDPHLAVALVRVQGEWAAARIDAPAAPNFGRQWVLLRRAAGVWRVLDTRTGRATGFNCKLAPAPVIPRLVGGCTIHLPDTESGLVQGPRAARLPTRAERSGIEASFVRRILSGRHVCPALSISVSRVDATWATASATCAAAGNGVVLYHRRKRGWTIADEASSGFPCTDAPPGVVRSLEGACWTS
jgi:hypothetical protein